MTILNFFSNTFGLSFQEKTSLHILQSREFKPIYVINIRINTEFIGVSLSACSTHSSICQVFLCITHIENIKEIRIKMLITREVQLTKQHEKERERERPCALHITTSQNDLRHDE